MYGSQIFENISYYFILHLQNGDTGLHIAAALKRRKITKLLVEAGVDVNIRNKVNKYAL